MRTTSEIPREDKNKIEKPPRALPLKSIDAKRGLKAGQDYEVVALSDVDPTMVDSRLGVVWESEKGTEGTNLSVHDVKDFGIKEGDIVRFE